MRQLTVYLTSDRIFRDVAHDRYLRFDNMVCQFGIGVEVFYGDRVEQITETNVSLVGWDGKENSYHARESKLKRGREYEFKYDGK